MNPRERKCVKSYRPLLHRNSVTRFKQIKNQSRNHPVRKKNSLSTHEWERKFVVEDTSNYFLCRHLHLQLAFVNFRYWNYSLVSGAIIEVSLILVSHSAIISGGFEHGATISPSLSVFLYKDLMLQCSKERSFDINVSIWPTKSECV